MSNQPVPTLYVTNLFGKTKKPELRQQLYALFTPYGKVIDVVALKTQKMRGQAFIVFAEQSAATAAMRALVGEEFYGQPLQITYAKSESLATKKLLDPTLTSSGPSGAAAKKLAKTVISRAAQEFAELEQERHELEEGHGVGTGKRALDGEEEVEGEDGKVVKKRKLDGEGGEEDEEEMEMDEDSGDEAGPTPIASSSSAIPVQSTGITTLLATDLPPEATSEVLSALFQQYPGFQQITLLPPGSTPTKSASITYSSLVQAETAQQQLNGFMLKEGVKMGVLVVPQTL